MNIRQFSAVAAIAAALSIAAVGARPPSTSHHGLMGRMTGHGMAQSHRGMGSVMAGKIIGNKRTHVYHLPGDTGNLPDPKNRVYFRTEAQARAAGYHRAGQSTTSHPMSRMNGHGMMGHGMMGHGMMGHGMMGHGMMGHGMMGHHMMGGASTNPKGATQHHGLFHRH